VSKITDPKFISPKLTRKCWLSDNLEEKFKQLDNHDLTILKAGIGAGKTTSLFSFLEKNQQQICYYQIENYELDHIKFWNNILKILKLEDLIEGPVQSLFDFSKPYQSIELLISDFLSQLDDDLYIILDNFEVVENNQFILETISYFIELSDSNIHLIISTTRKLKFAKLALWKVKNKVLQIDEEEFMVDKREVGDFFSQIYQLLLSNKEEKMIFAKTNGWLLAVDLLAKKVKEGIEVTDLVLNTEQKCDLLFEYLDYQVLSFLDKENPKLKEFLLQTSILPQLEVEICNCFLESDNSSKLINELIQAGVLIKKSQAGVYEYNPILKGFLQQRAKEIYDFKELIKGAKRVFYQHNNLEQIVNYNLKIDNNSEIIDLIHHNIDEWLAESKLNLLKKSFNALSKDDLKDKPLLLIYQGDLYRKLEKFHQAISSYQQAEELFKAEEEEKN
jgi:ATP/maltotriose-dependent transcriptional regulator MalT